MEDVIEVYHRPHDPDRPVVCVDETSKQLIVETRAPIPARPGQPRRVDYEYQRNGTANLFMMFAPLEGWRQVKVGSPHDLSKTARQGCMQERLTFRTDSERGFWNRNRQIWREAPKSSKYLRL